MTTTKIMLTKEQADHLGKYLMRWNGDVAEAIDEHAKVYNSKHELFLPFYAELNNLPPSDFARALLIGYTVKEEYKLMDWVAYRDSEGRLKIGEIMQRKGKLQYVRFLNHEKNAYYSLCVHPNTLRRATEKEIQQEKLIRKWLEFDRKVAEFKSSDILIDTKGKIYQACEVDAVELYRQGKLKGFYPAQTFVNLGDKDE